MIQYNDVRLGAIQVDKIYCGLNLVYEKKPIDSTAPITSIRPYDATNNPTNTYASGVQVYFDVNEMCDTFYTLDGSTPTTASTKYVGGGIWVGETTTIKYFSVDISGNAEAVKTTVYTIQGAANAPTTTISPTNTIQYNIPITVTLSTSEVGATIYYRVGTGAQQTYTAPFQVSQDTAGVYSTNITVAYWAVGAEGTEAEKTITYNTADSVPDKPVVEAIPGNWYVRLNWTPTANTTSYNVYRSTVAGTLGDMLAQYTLNNFYDDNNAPNDTTYYYTVRAANYGRINDSDQVSATPTAAPAQPSGWRYLKIEGYGSSDEVQTTRIIEFEAWEGATNRMIGATILSNEAPNAGTIAQLTDGVKTTSGYPLWWTVTPNARIVIDLGAERALTKLNYYGYSTAGVPRANRFKVLASNTNNGADWVTIWDMQATAEIQPALPSGYEKLL